MTLKHAKTSPAGAPSAPSLVGGDDWNADHVVDAGGLAMTSSASAPAAPAAGSLQLWARAPTALPAFVAPGAPAAELQPFLGRKAVSWWQPRWSVGALDTFGLAANVTSSITIGRTYPTPPTNLYSTMRRTGIGSSATAGSVARFSSAGVFHRGSTPGWGGFRMVLRWGCADAAPVAGARSFAGLAATMNGNPSSNIHLVGVGTDSGDTNLVLFTNDATGTATKLSLGANFPDHTLSVDAYELVLYCPPAASYINVEVTRLNTGHVFRTTVTSDLPAPDSAFSINVFLLRGNGAAASAVAVDCLGLYMETEY